MTTKIQTIVPCLWFDQNGEDAAKFYTSIFPSSRITHVSRFAEEGREQHGGALGQAMVVAFELAGQSFTALNGGPHFKFTEAISLQVMCETQDEIDRYWDALGEGGDPKARQCGWLKDKFGLSWQIVPTVIASLLSDPDPKKAGRTMKAMLQMKKLDIAKLRAAHAG